MDFISIRCKSCTHKMKFPGDKAGKKAKCPKCGTPTVIQAEELAAPGGAAPKGTPADDSGEIKLADISASSDQATVAPATIPPDDAEFEIKLMEDVPAPAVIEDKDAKKPGFDDEGDAQYGVYIDPELEERQRMLREEEEAKAKRRKEKKKLPKVTRKVKAIESAEGWEKVRIGLLLMFVGVCIWGFMHLLQGVYVLIGMVELPEYAVLIATALENRPPGENFPPAEQFWNVSEFDIYMKMIAGMTLAGFAKFCLITATVFYFFLAAAWGVGYVIICSNVPRTAGMFGQSLVMMGLLVFNVLIMFIFKFLPMVGAFNYIMIPFVVPEIAMTEYNMDRSIPINILWSGAPFTENFFCLIFKFLFYLEPTFASILLWSIGAVVKNDEVAEGGKSLTQMSLGSFFVLLAFHLLSVCGATPVLIMVLRTIYILWYCFLLMFILRYAMLLLKCRSVLDEKIHPKNELQEE
jgi:hypothetical protein